MHDTIETPKRYVADKHLGAAFFIAHGEFTSAPMQKGAIEWGAASQVDYRGIDDGVVERVRFIEEALRDKRACPNCHDAVADLSRHLNFECDALPTGMAD